MKLTQRTVDKLGSQEEIIWDDEVPGFGVRVYASGKKSYFVRARVGAREKKMITIGDAKRTQLFDARTEALNLLLEFRKGNDGSKPKAHEMTVKHAMDYFYNTHGKELKSHSEILDTAKLINGVVGYIRLVDLNKQDIMDLKSEVGAVSLSQANKALGWLRSAINHCRGEITELHHIVNPCQFVKKFKIHARDTYVKADEMPRLLEAIKKEPNPYGRAAIILYILLGQRKDEILRIEYKNIDMIGKRIMWPDTKNKKKHHIPIPDEAMEILRRIPRVIGSPWLFPAMNPAIGLTGQTHLKDIRRAWNRIRKDADMTHVTVHDLRRTLGSWMAMGGEPLALIGKILNHSSPAVTAEHYAHFDDASQREALNRHAKKVLSIR